MKNHRFDRYIYMGVTAILVVVAAVLVIFMFLERKAVGAAFGKMFSILAPIIFGAVLAFLMSPVYNFCYRNVTGAMKSTKIKNEKAIGWMAKTAGTVISLAFLVLVLVSLSSLILPQLYTSIVGIVNAMPVYFLSLIHI